MGHDPFNPLVSARVNVLVIPAGQIRTSRYNELLARLQAASRSSVSSALWDRDENDAQDGSLRHLLYDFSPAQTESAKINAYPFELNRVPQILLALADGQELDADHGDKTSNDVPLSSIVSSFDQHKRQYATTWLQTLVVFDYGNDFRERQDILCVPRSEVGDVQDVQALLLQVAQLFAQQAAEIAVHIHEGPISSPQLASGMRTLADRKRPRLDRRLDGPQPGSNAGSRSATPAHDSGGSQHQLQAAVVSRSESPATASPAAETSDSVQKGRSLIIRGNLYLQSGEWQKALNELTLGAVHAQTCMDHMWYAKALESLAVCSLLLSRSPSAFEVPFVLQATDGSQTQQPPKPFQPRDGVPSARDSSPLQVLIRLAPTLVARIMGLMVRGTNPGSNENGMPPLMICECKIRLTNLLCALHASGNSKPYDAVDALILGSSNIRSTSTHLHFYLPDVASSLLQVVTDYQPQLDTKDFVNILIGLSSSLANLQLSRKQTFYLHELFQRLAPILIEARKIGAAEMGVHPAAGLSLLSDIGESRTVNPGQALTVLFDTAVQSLSPTTLVDSTKTDGVPGTSSSARDRITFLAMDVVSGDKTLRMELLRTCISICDALPDPVASLRFTVKLLETSRQIITVSADSANQANLLPPEEQQRILGDIKRTVAAANKLGLHGVRAPYWDDLLVRGVSLIDVQGVSKLSSRTSRGLTTVLVDGTKSKDPFIFNSFSKARAAARTEKILVAGERADFRVTLQNPFEFGVEIDAISLLTEGCAFEPLSHSVVLDSLSVQDFVLCGIPKESGQLKVSGCRVKVRDCYEQDFSIFGKVIRPVIPVKLKSHSSTHRRYAGEAEATLPAARPAIEAEFLGVTVIDHQPYLSVSNTSPPQPSLMILEGEVQTFEITLHNQSKTLAADFLLFTFEDSATKQLQNALDNKGLDPTEVYEISDQLLRPSIQLKQGPDASGENRIDPGGRRSFTFEVYAKPGLTNAVVQVDYAHRGRSHEDIRGEFYTRQLRHFVTVTVNGSVDIPRFNIQPLSDNFLPLADVRPPLPRNIKGGLFPGLSELQSHDHEEGYCLLLIDLRNVWPHPLQATIEITRTHSGEPSPEPQPASLEALHETLQPGHTSRVVLAMPRIFLPEPHNPIPSIRHNQRQFVLSASQTSPEAELTAREAFWSKEELLKNIRATWTDPSTSRRGEINLRKSIRLNARMIDALLNGQVDISFSLRPTHYDPDTRVVQQLAKSHFCLQTETFANLVVRVRNRSRDPIRLLLRLQPSLRDQPHRNLALDLSKKFLWSGVLQRPLHPAVEPEEVREATLGVVALVPGEFEVSASVEEIRSLSSRRAGPRDLRGGDNSSGSGNTSGTTTSLTGGGSRRIWHARDPCWIDAVVAPVPSTSPEFGREE